MSSFDAFNTFNTLDELDRALGGRQFIHNRQTLCLLIRLDVRHRGGTSKVQLGHVCYLLGHILFRHDRNFSEDSIWHSDILINLSGELHLLS